MVVFWDVRSGFVGCNRKLITNKRVRKNCYKIHHIGLDDEILRIPIALKLSLSNLKISRQMLGAWCSTPRPYWRTSSDHKLDKSGIQARPSLRLDSDPRPCFGR
jgi:hypothetical protein